ncbi:MAG TPA: GNAT family N-acetyltransferase [Clostridiales bacterium]|nr:GNAT family N-acetyltransferase [Clostridiales bacterium]
MYIRQAQVDDVQVLGEIHALTWKHAYKGIVPDSVLDQTTAEKRQLYFKKALTEKWEEDYLIFYREQPAGLICIGKCRDQDMSSDVGEIWGIYILPAFQGKGVGTYSIKWALEELKSRGYTKVTLWVLEENLHARRFYEYKGFQYKGMFKEIQLGKTLIELRYEKEM